MKKLYKKGISLIVLTITVVVLILLVGALIISGVNAQKRGTFAIFANNITALQDEVTLKMLNNTIEGTSNGYIIENYKWEGVVQGYTYDNENANIEPIFNQKINGVDAVNLAEEMREGTNMTAEEFAKYYVDKRGVLYYYDTLTGNGFEYEGIIYYNLSTTMSKIKKIEITIPPTKTKYIVGEIFNASGMVITATKNDNTTVQVTGYTLSPSEPLQTTDTAVTIAYGGQIVTQAITVTQAISQLGISPSNYGTTVSGYSANSVADWKLFYHEEINGNTYYYIIPSGQTANSALTMYSGSNKENIINNAKTYFRLGKLANGDDSGYDYINNSNENIQAITWLLDTSIWNVKYKTGNVLEEYIQDVIGTPTMEMFIASLNAKTETSHTYTINGNGNSNAGIGNSNSFTDSLYKTGGWYWMTAPSNSSPLYVRFVFGDGGISDRGYTVSLGLRPVVCLKYNTPAHWSGDTIIIGS